MKLEHSFISDYKAIDSFFTGITSFDGLSKKIAKYSDKISDGQDIGAYNPVGIKDQSNLRDKANKFAGDSFELFVEFLIKTQGWNPCIAIDPESYHPSTKKDMGVDGYGIGLNGLASTVQVKFRRDITKLLNEDKDHLSNFVMQSVSSESANGYGVNQSSDQNMLIITSCRGLFYKSMNLFERKVRCLGRDRYSGSIVNSKYQSTESDTQVFSLKQMTDNNIQFWRKLDKEIKEQTK